MSKREFLQQAHKYNSIKHCIGGYYVSEKLDGMRAYWDGGFTRGQLTSQIPFANTLKDYRRVTPVRSTGLWSRYAKPILAPEWWLDSLPDTPLDGELYAGVGRFQFVISTVKKFVPVDREWSQIGFSIYDIPSDYYMFSPGKINNPQWTADFDDMRHLPPQGRTKPISFRRLLDKIENLRNDIIEPVTQYQLPYQTEKAERELEEILNDIVKNKGEGVILRRPDSIWQPTRNYDILKVKKFLDSEAMVIGYTWGKGKLEGLMGSLTVSWHNKTFELSGFTDAERYMPHSHLAVPGQNTGIVQNMKFPIGSIVTFKYTELSDDGIPKVAGYWRK